MALIVTSQLFAQSNHGRYSYTANVYRDLRGSHRFFSVISMEKGWRDSQRNLYFSKGKIVYVVGKPYDNYRISPQSVNITRFPHNIHNLSL